MTWVAINLTSNNSKDHASSQPSAKSAVQTIETRRISNFATQNFNNNLTPNRPILAHPSIPPIRVQTTQPPSPPPSKPGHRHRAPTNRARRRRLQTPSPTQKTIHKTPKITAHQRHQRNPRNPRFRQTPSQNPGPSPNPKNPRPK